MEKISLLVLPGSRERWRLSGIGSGSGSHWKIFLYYYDVYSVCMYIYDICNEKRLLWRVAAVMVAMLIVYIYYYSSSPGVRS